MAINYVKGQILANVLQRDGNNLSIVNTANSSPTLYVDVANGRIGINTATTTTTLTVNGNITGGNVVMGTVIISNIGNINAGNVNINNLATPTANADAATKLYVDQSISGKTVTNQTLYGNGIDYAFTLNRTTTTSAALVVLNGITQLPYDGTTGAYFMNPSPSANLVFTETPQTGDVIDVRFL